MMPSILARMCTRQRSLLRFWIPPDNLVMEAILETKIETILQFLRGIRGSLHVTFEEGTSAACLAARSVEAVRHTSGGQRYAQDCLGKHQPLFARLRRPASAASSGDAKT